jgi:hypothetical protein
MSLADEVRDAAADYGKQISWNDGEVSAAWKRVLRISDKVWKLEEAYIRLRDQETPEQTAERLTGDPHMAHYCESCYLDTANGTAKGIVEDLTAILDGKEQIGRFGWEPLQTLTDRLKELRRKE